MTSVLVLGAGSYQAPLLKHLREAGFRVVACDRNRDAPGKDFVDHFAPVDIVDRQAVLEFAREAKVDGVLPINEFGSPTAAYVAAALGFVSNPPESATWITDKGHMRDRWRNAGMPQPDYRIGTDIQGIRRAAEEVGFPCVLKPTNSGGSGRGVSVVRSPNDIEWAYEFARVHALNGRLILEEFLDGVEMTVETITYPGRGTSVLAMSDKEKPDLRTRVALSLNYPANFPDAVLQKVEQLVAAAVEAVSVTAGMAHTEVIVTKDGAKLVETGARGGGGHVFHPIIRAASGIDAPVIAARIATGQTVTRESPRRSGAVYRFFNPPKGILRAVRGLAEARAVEGVLDIGILKRPGDRVGELPNSLHRAGFVVTAGPDRDTAIRRADKASALVHFVVQPDA